MVDVWEADETGPTSETKMYKDMTK